MLEVNHLNVFYDNIHAVKSISFKIKIGEIVSIIGANGAGKSTILNSLAGIKSYKSGEVILDGEDLTKCKNYKLVEKGIVLVPEGRLVFPKMSVEENLKIGAYLYSKDVNGNETRLKGIYELFPRLLERRTQKAGTLSGGEQQMLVIGRALMSRPRVLMLDEPSLGLAPIVVTQIFKLLIELNKTEGITILLVEQNARMALGISHRTYVLENGRIILEGLSKELRADPRVQTAYL